MTCYSPAEAAQKTGFSLDTLRYYERIGLLPPVGRTAGGRRRYGDTDLLWLMTLRCLRDTGMPLREMRDLPQYHTLTNRWSNKRGMRGCNIGVLASPFMRSALVIEVNPLAVRTSEIRPARFYTNFKDGHFSHLVHPQLSPTWVVPTRHPEALRTALQAIPGDRDVVSGK